jgi:predicted MFS family arabinose efflux permease
VGWWNWIAQALPEDAEAGGGLMVAVIQLTIALGSTAADGRGSMPLATSALATSRKARVSRKTISE